MRGGTTRAGARRELVASPVFVGSVALLLLNDHVLKAAWPGFVTGKLSDIAGVAMVAVGLTALTRRPAPAFALTAVLFALLKTVPAVAVWTSPVIGGVTLTDPTDLLALAVLVPLWWWVGGGRPTDAPRAVWVVPLQIMAITAAVVATSASDCSPEGVSGIFVAADGTLVADTYPMHVSRNGGATWVAERVDWPAPSDLRCFADGVCVELDAFESPVELSASDGSVVSAFDADEVDALQQLDRPSCAADLFSDLVVVERDGDEHIVVAMGWLGVLHAERGEPFQWVAVGEWGIQRQDVADRPLGFDVAEPAPDQGVGFRLPRRLAQGLVVLTMAVPFAAYAPSTRLAHRRGRYGFGARVWISLVAVTALLGGGYLLVSSVMFEPTNSELTAVSLAFLAYVVGALAVILGVQAVSPRRSLAPPDAADRVG